MDIFATKGPEYILILGYLFLFVLFWKFLQRSERRTARAAVSSALGAQGGLTRWFRLPEGFQFHRGHSWAFSEGNSLFKVGMTDFTQKLLGMPEAIVLPRVGQRLTQGDSGWALKVDGHTLRQLSPLSGTVIEVNQEVLDNPRKLTEDPYESGWLIKVRADRTKATAKNLLPASLARLWTEESFNRLMNYGQPQLGLVLQDGGVPVDGLVKHLGVEDWPRIARQFLLSEDISSNAD